MQLNKKEKKYKLYLSLLDEMDKLWQKIKDLPLIKLDKPYQKGWDIKLELREDIARREDAHVLQKVLDISYHNGYTNQVKHVKMIRKGIKGYSPRHGLYINFLPSRRDFNQKKYDELEPQVKKYFSEDTYRSTLWRGKVYYGSLPEFYLRIKARPHIITHIREKGGELESQYNQLRHRVYWSGEFQEFIINYGSTYPKNKDRTRTRDKIQKFKKGEVDDIYNERIPRDWDY